MNEVLRLLCRHRSVRRYAPEDVSDAHVRLAVRAGQSAPTSGAVQAYCAIRVRDRATLARLVELTGGQTKVAEAGLFLVVCADSRRHRLAAARAGRPYDARLEAFLVAVVDAALFAQNLAVAFESMGYGVCYVGGLRNRIFDVDRLLGLPHGVYPLFGLAVGRPAEDPPLAPRLPLEAVLFEERYPSDATMLGLLDRHDRHVASDLGSRGEAPQPWTARVVDAFASPRRPDVAAFYRSKGAVLE